MPPSLMTHVEDGPACACTGNSMLASLAVFMEIGNMLDTIFVISRASSSNDKISHFSPVQIVFDGWSIRHWNSDWRLLIHPILLKLLR